MYGDCTICWGMYGNDVQIYMMRKYMTPTEFLEEEVGVILKEVYCQLHEKEVILRNSILMTWDFDLQRILDK